jgi:putative ABC transport system ATP-binding protein
MQSPPQSQNLLEVRGLSRHYKVGPSDVRALDGLDLDIHRGEFLAVTGVSGSGKSTLLYLLGGLDTPTSGSIRYEDRDLASFSSMERTLYRRTTVGFLFQFFHLVPSMTAQANVELALTFQGVYGKDRRLRAAEALQRVGLAQRAGHKPSQLSGGEQQRVALARALVHRPPLLLLDEPTGNLDRATAAEMLELVRGIHEEMARAVILVTHDEEAARRFADRALRIRDGRLMEEAS